MLAAGRAARRGRRRPVSKEVPVKRRRRRSSRRYSAVPRSFGRRRRRSGGLGVLGKFIPDGTIHAAGGAVAGVVLPDWLAAKFNKSGTMSPNMLRLVRLGITGGLAYAAKRILRSNAAALGVVAGAAASELAPYARHALGLSGFEATGDVVDTLGPNLNGLRLNGLAA
jgi:hypothetical protein